MVCVTQAVQRFAVLADRTVTLTTFTAPVKTYATIDPDAFSIPRPTGAALPVSNVGWLTMSLATTLVVIVPWYVL